MPDSLGDRMKEYENVSRIYLTKKLPVIIRIDGRAFHTFTRGFQRPFDKLLHEAMWSTAEALCNQISGVKMAYVQSDEISLLLTNDESAETQPWFGNNLQKLVSVSASIATLAFNKYFNDCVMAWMRDPDVPDDDAKRINTYIDAIMKAQFDSRAFVIPSYEVINYFIWRQQDATRNSVQLVAQSLYSHKELHKKNTSQLQEMIFQKGINWNDYPTYFKRGLCIVKKPVVCGREITMLQDGTKEQPIIRNKFIPDYDIPIFTQQRDYIEGVLKNENV